ncbi:MAG: homoserine O-acetyltransferase family protein [Chitinophagaceae bacterium]
MSYKLFTYNQPFILESGKTLSALHLAYTTLGKLNKEKNNVVWIFHALTANSNPAEWWPGLVGEEKLFNPKKHFIVCVNMPGSCYGSISPLDADPTTGEIYYHYFPWFTPRDMIRAYHYLKNFLAIEKIFIGIGGSMGGQQLLEWAIEEPELFEHIIPVATNAQHSQWGIAFNESQRWCIENDATWKEKNERAGIEGMKIARSIALISYRHYETYKYTLQSALNGKVRDGATYQRYQGEKLARRFNAFSYYFLSKGMDAHNVGRARVSVKDALKKIKAKTLVIGISSDILYPAEEQELLAKYIPDAEIKIIDSLYGHDGFLLEYEKITKIISEFISAKNKKSNKYLHQIIQ